VQEGSIVLGIYLFFLFFLLYKLILEAFIGHYSLSVAYMQFLHKIHVVCLEVLTYMMYYSGYADRIYELMAVSRELSLVDEKSSLQRNGSRNCISEANYIEFSNVKASQSCPTIYHP
jgi:hypothetical protein